MELKTNLIEVWLKWFGLYALGIET